MALTSLGSGQNYLLGKTPDILNSSFPINFFILSATNKNSNRQNKNYYNIRLQTKFMYKWQVKYNGTICLKNLFKVRRIFKNKQRKQTPRIEIFTVGRGGDN
jgi:hypothetical protein